MLTAGTIRSGTSIQLGTRSNFWARGAAEEETRSPAEVTWQRQGSVAGVHQRSKGRRQDSVFVGIEGDVGSFMKMGETSPDLANLVQHKNVVEFGLTSQNLAQFGGAVTYEKGEVGNANIRVLVNRDQMDITNRNLSPNSILGMSRWEGQSQRPRWNVNDFTPGIAAWHEFGHAWGFINGRPGSATNPEALQRENRTREQMYGPLGPRNARRTRH